MNEETLKHFEQVTVRIVAHGLSLIPQVDSSIQMSEFEYKDDDVPEVVLRFPDGVLKIVIKAEWSAE